MPFISELVYKNLATSHRSVHLQDWPRADLKAIDRKLEADMKLLRQFAAIGHAKRKRHGINLRQPLQSLTYQAPHKLSIALEELIKEEVNVKQVFFTRVKDESKMNAYLDAALTEALIKEGQARQIIRDIQVARKKAGCKIDQEITVTLPSWPEKFSRLIKEKTLAKKLLVGKQLKVK